MWQRIWIVISLYGGFIVLNGAATPEETGNHLTLGDVDDTLLYMYTAKLAALEPVTDLYVSTGGLYLLPENVSFQGLVREICVFGYTKQEYLDAYMERLRPFVYVMLYRNDPENWDEYYMVYRPALVHHTPEVGCLDAGENGLEWKVEVGDKIGVFILENCINVTDMPDQLINNFIKGDNFFDVLCPSQIDIINGPVESLSALFLNNSCELTLEELDYINIEDVFNVSVHLNVQVMLSPMENEDSSKSLIIGVVVAAIIAVLVFLILMGIICLFFYLRRLKKDKTEETGLVTTSNGSPLTVQVSTPTITKHYPGYENDAMLNSYIEDNVNNSIKLSDDIDHDYDEPYFEPATEEEAILEQLCKLAIPTIEEESLEMCEVLGSGAFATVYRGVWHHSEGDESVEEEVAVKLMENGSSEADRVKFLQEAAIMGQFNHPSIIQLLGVIQNFEGKLKIVVNLMKGDLKNHLVKLKESINSEVPPELSPTLLSYTRQIAFGMTYLSAKSFIHRDLAARNILVSGDGTTCKIADFGLSRELQQKNYYVSHGGRIPVKWTAPEALHYHKYSTASDVWSYGCVLYEIWSLGSKPFQEQTNQQAMKLIGSGFRLPPPPGCPKTIYQIMIKCWNPKVDDRPGFCDVVVSIQQPDFQILKWTQDDENKYSKLARTLGAPIEKGSRLYMDLQRLYIVKEEEKVKDKNERTDVPVKTNTNDGGQTLVEADKSNKDKEQMLVEASTQDENNCKVLSVNNHEEGYESTDYEIQ